MLHAELYPGTQQRKSAYKRQTFAVLDQSPKPLAKIHNGIPESLQVEKKKRVNLSVSMIDCALDGIFLYSNSKEAQHTCMGVNTLVSMAKKTWSLVPWW